MGTLIEEIFSRKAGRPVQVGEIVVLDLDYMMSHDNTTPLAMKAFRELGKPILDKNKVVVHFDHAYPAPNLLAAEAQKQIVDFMKEQGILQFYHQGICHQVMIEEGYIQPGRVLIGGDSHSNTYGAFGAFGTGLGSTEIGIAWVTGKTWFRVPETILVKLEGQMQPGVFAKDVMLYIVGMVGMDGATYKSVEFAGSYMKALPMHERILFANMSTEIGAKCGLVAPDETTVRFLESETKARGPFEIIKAENPNYERIIEIDVTDIGPQVACHPDVDHVQALEQVEGLPIEEVFIGTCTNGRYEDLEIAAQILKGNRVSPFTRAIVTPASVQIYDKAMQNGLIQIFHDAGCTIGVVGCGACIGRHGGLLGPGERAFTTMNRNFIGRMGSPKAEIYLGSPAAAAATAIAGKIADPREYLKNQ
jgi:3-isopropylmalate/(R)-2-methylmalate dehydratase large subunit